MDNSDMVGTQITVAMMSSYAIEWLKHQAWFPFSQVDEVKLNRLFAAAVALATSIGLTAVFDKEAGTLLISGLTMDTARHAGWLAIQQYVFQHGLYKAVVKRPVLAEKVTVTLPESDKVEKVEEKE